MEKMILIKYGELTLKGGNGKVFRVKLRDNIQKNLPNCRIKFERSRMYVFYEEEFEEKVIDVLQKTFGLVAFSICEIISRDLETMYEEILRRVVHLKGSFKVIVKRADKSFPLNSPQLAEKIGSHLNYNTDLTVDLTNPDYKIYVELRRDKTYFYINEYRGLGGLPVGCSEKGLLLLSGGIDSPVAGHLMNKRGVHFDALHFESFPYTSEQALEKVEKLAKVLRDYNGDFNLYVVRFTKIQEELLKHVLPSYFMVVMRRMMYRIAQRICDDKLISHLINGDSIGQVASQTIPSMLTVDDVVKVPLIRPLAIFDKFEVIRIAEKIGTYSISNLPFEDCCTVFLPKNPQINPKLDKTIKCESFLDYEGLIEEALHNMKIIKINDKNEFEELL